MKCKPAPSACRVQGSTECLVDAEVNAHYIARPKTQINYMNYNKKPILCFCSGSGEDEMGVANTAIQGEG